MIAQKCILDKSWRFYCRFVSWFFTDGEEQEHLSKKIIAYGLIDYRQKLSSVVNDQLNRDGYNEVLEYLARFDNDFLDEIEKDYKKNHNWFGTSFSKLAHSVKEGSGGSW